MRVEEEEEEEEEGEEEERSQMRSVFSSAAEKRRSIRRSFLQVNFQETDSDQQTSSDANGGGCHANSLTDIQRHQIKHRELFLSRQVECLPATHMRGKCSVTLYNDVEPLTSYVQREDAFYYRLIYDPSTKRLQEDRGSMRIGSDYQSEIQPLLKKGNSRSSWPERRTASVARVRAIHKTDIAALSEIQFAEQGQLEELAGGEDHAGDAPLPSESSMTSWQKFLVKVSAEGIGETVSEDLPGDVEQ
nr:unnamed protein product [Spirometra erinaceieuropaei]